MDGSAFHHIGDALVFLFWTAIIAVICAVGLGGFVIWDWAVAPDWQAEAISRGYAIYCPDSGDFAWVDECPTTP